MFLQLSTWNSLADTRHSANSRCKLEKSLTYTATLNNKFTKTVHPILTANSPKCVERISEHCDNYFDSMHLLLMTLSSMANTDTRTVILKLLDPAKNSEARHYRSTTSFVQDVTVYHQNKFQTTTLIFSFYM